MISAMAALILVADSCVAFKPGSTGYSATWLSVLGGEVAVDPNIIAIADATLFINFDGTFDDQSANAISATSNDNVSFAGSIGTFDGTNDWLHYGDSATVEVGTNDFSFSLWVKLAGTQPNADTSHIVGNTAEGAARGGGIFYASGAGLQFRTASGVIQSSTATNNINDSNWHHLAATFDRDGNMILYINKVQESSTSIASGNGLDLQDTRNFGVGARTIDSAFDYYGSMDSIYYFKRLLTTEEIETLYNAGHDP